MSKTVNAPIFTKIYHSFFSITLSAILGQTLDYDYDKVVAELSPDAPFTERLMVYHRRLLGILIPMTFFITFWLAIVTKHNLWFIFKDNYFMSIVMVFGSLIAGMTSEGGGAIAFPVMTLAFKIHPNVARDFSLIVQSCGMTAAAFTIFFMRVKIDWTAIITCSIGGVVGVVFGLELIDPHLAPALKKFIFVSVWFSFGFALFLLNRYHNRRTFLSIPCVNVWKICFLLVTGFFGGNFTAIAASGLDICTFSMLTLVFRVTEKTATPTSVVLMAGNTMFAFFWRDVMMNDGIHHDAWNYLVVSAPIVVVGAPLGSIIGTHFHRLVLASFVYIVGTASLIGAFAIIRPLTTLLICMSLGIIAFAFILFLSLTFLGQKLLKSVELEENLAVTSDVSKTPNPVNESLA